MAEKTRSGLSMEVMQRMYLEAYNVLWRAGNEHPSEDQVMAEVKKLFIDPVVRDYIIEQLSIPKVAAYCRKLPVGAACGVAADEAATVDGDWPHRNVIADYLVATVEFKRACVDYHGVTIAEADVDFEFEQDLVWVPLFLKLLDITAQGEDTWVSVSREQCLAFFDLMHAYTWEEMLPMWEAFGGHALPVPRSMRYASSDRRRTGELQGFPWNPPDTWWADTKVQQLRLFIAWSFVARSTTMYSPERKDLKEPLLQRAERWLDLELLTLSSALKRREESVSGHALDLAGELVHSMGAFLTLHHLSKGTHYKLTTAWETLCSVGYPLRLAFEAIAAYYRILARRRGTIEDDSHLLAQVFQQYGDPADSEHNG